MPLGKHLGHRHLMCSRGMPTRDQNNYYATRNLLRNKSQKEENEDSDDREFSRAEKVQNQRAEKSEAPMPITESAFTWRRHWRMTAAPNPTCLFCTTGEHETIEHIR